MTSDASDRRANLKAGLIERLHDPLQLRICVVGVVLVLGYAIVYMPLGEQISRAALKQKRDRKLIELAGKIEALQTQYRTFEDRIPQQSDNKEWVQYMLDGVRRFPVKLSNLDCRPSKPVGPYKAVILQMQLEGSFWDLDQFLRWIESNKRLMRADEIRLTPGRLDRGIITMNLTVLGLTS